MKNPDDEDDFALFREAMRGAKPLKTEGRAIVAPPRPAPIPRQTQADEKEVLAEMMLDPDPESYEGGDTLSWKNNGVQDGVFRKLKRGQFHIDGELDLHGLNSEKAALAVSRFMADSLARDRRCVRIIHGKGLRSPNSGPVLKIKLANWLRKRSEVLAYVSARPEDGGTGAVYVLLRRT